MYAYTKIKDVTDELSGMPCSDEQAETLASEVDVTPQVPWTTGQQCHRENVEHASAEDYYRRILFWTIFDCMSGLVVLR